MKSGYLLGLQGMRSSFDWCSEDPEGFSKVGALSWEPATGQSTLCFHRISEEPQIWVAVGNHSRTLLSWQRISLISRGGETLRESQRNASWSLIKPHLQLDPLWLHQTCAQKLHTHCTDPGLAELCPPPQIMASSDLMEFHTHCPPCDQMELYSLSKSGSWSHS